MKPDTDTPEQKMARSNNGGEAQTQRSKLDVIWETVQAANRAAGPWGRTTKTDFHQEQS